MTIPSKFYYAESYEDAAREQERLRDFRALQERMQSYGFQCELVPDIVTINTVES